MPKMKTHRGAAKRFKKTGSGKIQRNHAFHSHILTKKSPGHRIAKEQVERGLNFAFAGRKDRKGEFRTLWIARINAAARLNGISYSKLMAGLKAAGNTLDRKVLADLAVRDAAAFTAIVSSAKNALPK